MPQLNTDTDALRLFRAIRGAPATILLLLMIRGVSMTGREICLYTGYDEKTVSTAKDCLQALGFIQNNGRFHGWSLRADSQALLPFMHLLDESYSHNKTGNSPITGEFPVFSLTTTTTIDPLDQRSKSSSRSRTKTGEFPVFSNGNGHSDVPIAHSDVPIAHSDVPIAHSDVPIAHHPTPAGDPRVATWLQRAGVGLKSRKYRELLQADLDWHTVRAHTLERLAQPGVIPVGLFITRLLDGDPPPAPRCPECYSPLNDYGQCSSILCGYYGEDDGENDEEE